MFLLFCFFLPGAVRQARQLLYCARPENAVTGEYFSDFRVARRAGKFPLKFSYAYVEIWNNGPLSF